MKYSKIYNVKEMNSYQFIALTGMIMTLLAHLILWLLDKTIDDFWLLYLCWLVLFAIGTVVNLRSKPGSGHHHH